MLRGSQLFTKVIFLHLTALGGEPQGSEIRYLDDIHANIDIVNGHTNKVVRNGLSTNMYLQSGPTDG